MKSGDKKRITCSYTAQIQREKKHSGGRELTGETQKQVILKEWQFSEKHSGFCGGRGKIKKIEVPFSLPQKIRLKTNTGKSEQNL